MSQDISVSVNIFGHVQFAISFALRVFQGVLAWVPTFLVRWILEDASNKFLREENGISVYQTRGGKETHAAHTFDHEWWRHRLWVGDVGQLIFKIYLIFKNDSANEKDIFFKLINSSPGTKFIGLAPGKAFHKVEKLAEHKGPASLCDMEGLHEVSVVGNFVLTGHQVDDSGEVVCRCVWVSGLHTGKTFEFHNPHGQAVKPPEDVESTSGGTWELQGMYIPPRLVRQIGIFIQVILGASGFFSAIKFVVETLKDLWL